MLITNTSDQSSENYWRSLILYGANVATYKFALGKSLLKVVETGQDRISLSDLSIYFAQYMCEHAKSGRYQCTNKVSAFIDACVAFNNDKISYDQLIAETKKTGFRYVLDAFHTLNGGQVVKRFYDIEGSGNKRNLILTDSLFELKDSPQGQNLSLEVDARWTLVEDAWTFNSGSIQAPVEFDFDTKTLYVEDRTTYRRNLTPAKNALSGYQKGKCFYCFSNILIGDDLSCHADHFIPFALRYRVVKNLDAIWNIVLSCKSCNSGKDVGKFVRIPGLKYLERLNRRNNYLIASNHPLSGTIAAQTGSNDQTRHEFLKSIHKFAAENSNEGFWAPVLEHDFDF